MFAQKTQKPWKTDLCRHNGEPESSQDSAPAKATCTITASHHHFTSAPCSISPLPLSLFPDILVSVLPRTPTSHTPCYITRLSHHIHSAKAATMAFWACTFLSYPQDSQPQLYVSLHDIHINRIPSKHKSYVSDGKLKPERPPW